MCPPLAHPDDQFRIDGLPQQGAMFGFPCAGCFTPTRWLAGGDTVQIGNNKLDARRGPGRTPGHAVCQSAQAKHAFVGGVLLAGSAGRTDLPQGNRAQLISSITKRLWPIGDDTVFIPGHGPQRSFGAERHSNPTCVASDARLTDGPAQPRRACSYKPCTFGTLACNWRMRSGPVGWVERKFGLPLLVAWAIFCHRLTLAAGL